MKKIQLVLGVILMSLITQLWAKENPQAMIVFDASGSMWGQINGQAKISIAKKALNKVVSDWDENVHLGLISYGHRKKGDCNDIQTLVPIGQINKKGMISKVKQIKPKGKTPISRSIKKAAEALKYTEEKATVILISDGKETCDADPCAAAKALEEQGIDFVTHVIGFDVDKQTDAELKCIADATGGEYFSAKDASSLNDAMGKIVKKVQKVEPKPPVVKKAKKPKNNLELTATETEGGKWIEALHYIYPIVDGEKQDEIQRCYSRKDEACLRQIPAGKYSLHSTYNEFKQDTELEIKESEVSKLNIVMGQTGKIEITASESEGGKWIEALHYIYPILDGEKQDEMERCYSRKDESCVKQIPVGKYAIHSTFNKFKQDGEFEIKSAEIGKIHVVMGQTGKIEITASESEDGKWIEALHYIYPILDGEKQDEMERCYSREDESCVMQIPVGKYSLHSTYKEFKKDSLFEIKSAEGIKLAISFAPLHLTIKGIHSCAQISHEVVSARGQTITELQSVANKGADFVLPDGNYTIESTSGNKTLKTKVVIGGENPTKDAVVNFQAEQTTNDSIVGIWKTSKGEAILHLDATQVTGEYGDGKINGEMTYPQRFEGFWNEANSGEKCQQSKNGGDYWGKIVWEFDDDMCAFKGHWGYCQQEPDNDWSGSYLKPLAQAKPSAKEANHDELIKADTPVDTRQESKAEESQSKPASEKHSEAKHKEENTDSLVGPDVKNALAQAGALLGGLKAIQQKPIQAFKESISAALPDLKKAKTCYQGADELVQAKTCEEMEETALKQAKAVMEKSIGFSSNANKLIKHTEWNDEIKKRTVEKTETDIKKMELSIICLDKGADFSQLNKCIANNGEFTAKKSDLEKMGDLFKAFGQ